jgi:hypothetical protein
LEYQFGLHCGLGQRLNWLPPLPPPPPLHHRHHHYHHHHHCRFCCNPVIETEGLHKLLFLPVMKEEVRMVKGHA